MDAQIISSKERPVAAIARTLPTAPLAEPRAQRLVIAEDSAGQRLDNFLLKQLKGVPKTHVYRIVRSGEVRVNGGRAGADTRLSLGDEVRLPPVRMAVRPVPAPSRPPAQNFPVLFEDELLLAIDKPAGLAVHGGSGIAFGAIEQLRSARPEARFLELVHRLDKETSGVLLIAKRRSALVHLQRQFRDRQLEKRYAALVAGRWPASRKVIDVPLARYLTSDGERRVKAVDAARPPAGGDEGARRSISIVTVGEIFEAFTLLDVALKTGRTHQIRVHLAAEGHGIVGDDKYGDFSLNKALARGDAVRGIAPATRFDRMFLHARYLRFAHPGGEDPVEIASPLPAACRALLKRLQRQSVP